MKRPDTPYVTPLATGRDVFFAIMNPRVKIITAIAIILLVLALIAGLYWSGFLLIFLLDLDDQVSLSWNTYWRYWQALALPEFAPYALRIEIAGGMGFGMPLLAWLGLLFLLKPWSAWTSEDAHRASHENDKPTPSDRTEQATIEKTSPEPPPDVPDQERLVQQMWLAEQKRRINEQRAARESQPPIAASNQPINSMEDEDMNLKQMAVTAMLATAAVTVTPAGGAERDGYSLAWLNGGPTVHFNRHPQEIYEITLTIHDAPGPLEPGGTDLSYVIPDAKCIPSHLLSKDGTAPFACPTGTDNWFKWPNTKISTAYKTYIATDLMMDEDYYGKGVCHWTLDKLKFNVMRGNGKDPNQVPWQYDEFVMFYSTIQENDIQSGKEIKTYFLKDIYNNPENHRPDILGGVPLTEEEYLKLSESEHSKYFYTTLSVKKVKPKPSLQHWIWLQYRRTNNQ